jgi:WD40 repeat protein/energy-coupling factor transporter ATP-binding protein EcfA2
LPDVAAVKALFLPALHLENEPELTKHLLKLAESARQEDSPAPGIAPYKGLLFFDESDAELFFGREALTAKLVRHVLDLATDASTRFLAVVGASGSGKSSLVRAGLAVALKRAGWGTRVFTPTATSDCVLILVDQFEEVFTLCHDELERITFIEQLLLTAHDTSKKTTVVIALRADFYPHCAQYPLLRQAVAAEQEYIGQMTTEELRRAIEEPAKRGGWDFEPGLVDVLLQDIGAHGSQEPEPGALPLLSHALLATWERRQGHVFTLDGYHASGGVRRAIAETAESVFTDQLNQEQQKLAHDVFLRLTELGEGTEDTRRRAALNELVRQSAEAIPLRTVLNTLAEARLITLNEDNAEIAHEALIREWQRLRDWLNEDREGLKLHRHLTETVRAWEARGHDPSELYRGARLANAREWMTTYGDRLNQPERDFLAASIEHEQHEALEREAQRQRELQVAQKLAETEKARAEEQLHSVKHLRQRAAYLIVALSIAIIAAVIAGVFANRNGTLAAANASIAEMAQIEAAARATQQSIAEANFTRAEAQRLAAEATNLMSAKGNSQTAALLTLRSLNLEYTPQGDAALLTAINLNYPVQVFTGSKSGVEKVAFSPDDKLILTGSDDHTVRLFDAQSGKQLQVYNGHTEGINDIAFSADGKLVLTASWDKTVRLWDTATGRELKKFVGYANVITADFSQDEKQILTGSEDEPVSAFSLEGSYAVGYSETNNANQLWDIKTLTKTYSFSYSGPPNRLPIQFSPDGKYLLASYGKEIVLSDVASGQEVQIFRGHTDGVGGVALSPDDKYVLSASADRTARLWDIETGQEVQRFSGHAASVYSVAFSSDGRRILTGGADGTVLLWDIEAHSELPILNGKNGDMFAVAFSPDGKHLATNAISNQLRLWDISTRQALWSTQDSGLALWALAFSPDGRYLVSGNMDGVTTLWDANTGEKVRQFTAQGLDEINALMFSPDRKTILAGGLALGSVETFAPIWEVETGREFLRIPLPAPIFTASFSSDGKYVVTGGGGNEGISHLWDAWTGTKLREFTGSLATFSPDGKFIVTVQGPTGFIWDTQTGEEIRRFEGPADGLGFVVYSPDGNTIASPTFDGSVRLWNAQTGRESRRYPHAASANNIAFSPDSKYIVSVSADGIARFFDVDYHTTMQYLCSILLRDFTDAERVQFNIRDHEPTCPP